MAMTGSGSDSEDEQFLPYIPDDIETVDDIGMQLPPAIALPLDWTRIEECLLLRDATTAQTMLACAADEESIAALQGVQAFLRGEYVSVAHNSGVPMHSVLAVCTSAHDSSAITAVLDAYLAQSSGASTRLKVFQSILVAYSCLELFCQANYTGPELSDAALAPMLPASTEDATTLFNNSLRLLECDGSYCYRICAVPHCLLVARAVLAHLAAPLTASWQSGVLLSEDGAVVRNTMRLSIPDTAAAVVQGFSCQHWLSARATVIHTRLLQSKTFSTVPTLWKEANDSFAAAIAACPALPSASSLDVHKALLHLEWGLCFHFFEYGDKGRNHFANAKALIGLTAELSGAMGKRTKYQMQDFAQLLLEVRSSLVSMCAPEKTIEKHSGLEVKTKEVLPEEDKDEASTGGWVHSQWEVGRRVVKEASNGEEAAVREIFLDETDGGPEENILYEGGPKYVDSSARSAELHPIDQAVVLALCLDVENSNPVDGLTTEEMFPYVERVLVCSRNWMVHSTALLQRSWLEYEKRRTADRALLQIQALLDQHTSKLTLFQSTYKSIEESAPVQDRLMYLHSIVYPSQCELKRDLADRYLKFSVFQSALGLFRELECWDEIVTCYQLLDKPHRAELVVRERLQFGETPYMLTSLADLTGDVQYYERAWTLSNGRYARAKRTLGRITFDKGLYEECVSHLEAALLVQPLVPHAWYLKGVACMRLERYADAVLAFTRCVQQDMEIGEAYANIGAVHMKMNDHAKAYTALTEALKQKRDSWMVIENLLTVCLSLGRLKEAVMHMNRLLDLRHKSNRPIHLPELRKLAMFVASQTKKAALIERAKREDTSESAIRDEEMPVLAKEVESLLVRISNTLQSTAEVWDLFADFQMSLGRLRQVLDCRYKETRAASLDPSWAKQASSAEAVVAVAEKLTRAHVEEVTEKADVYGCISLLKGLETQVAIVFPDSVFTTSLREFATVVKERYKHLV